MTGLTKRREALVRSLQTRHGRKKSGLCLCEGLRCCSDVVAARPDLVDFIIRSANMDAHFPGMDVVVMADEDLRKLCSTVSPQGVLAVLRRPGEASGQPSDPFIMVLDRVSDPGNFGTILRTARAAGLHELWYVAGSVDPFNDKVIRSAMAAQFVLGLRCFESLGELLAALAAFGYRRVYRTDVGQGADCFTEAELFSRSAIIFGSEAHGVAELDNAISLTIPMPGDAESLNVAQAATIILFEHVRRQRISS